MTLVKFRFPLVYTDEEILVVIYLCAQDGAPRMEHHDADDTTVHDHRHQEDHHHTQLRRNTHQCWSEVYSTYAHHSSP